MAQIHSRDGVAELWIRDYDHGLENTGVNELQHLIKHKYFIYIEMTRKSISNLYALGYLMVKIISTLNIFMFFVYFNVFHYMYKAFRKQKE